MSERFDIVLDNPILMKHVRSRLRPAQVIPWAVVVLVIGMCIIYGGYAFGAMSGGTPLAFVVAMQVVILVFGGAGQIGAAVGGAREKGLMDFHRVSPLPPSWVALGFFLGAPIREYVLVALTLPFAIFCAVESAGLWRLVEVELPMILAAWIIHAIALLGALMTKKPKAKGGGVIGLVVLALFLGQPIFTGILFATGAMPNQPDTLAFFGLSIPWMLFLLLYEIPIWGFLFLAAVRKTRSERAHPYTKHQAIACLATLAVLTLGATWSLKGVDYVVLGMLYFLTGAGCVLTWTITPDANQYIKGLRRAVRQGRRRPSPWEEAGTNRLAVFALCGIVLVGTTIAWEAIEGRVDAAPLYSLTIAIGVLVVAYTGLGYQAAVLRSPRRGGVYMQLFLFFVWLVPLLVGAIAAAGGSEERVAQAILGISPLAGIALSTGQIEPTIANVARAAALAPALTFAFVFNFLLDVVQRRIDLKVRGAAPKSIEGPFGALDEQAAPARL